MNSHFNNSFTIPYDLKIFFFFEFKLTLYMVNLKTLLWAVYLGKRQRKPSKYIVDRNTDDGSEDSVDVEDTVPAKWSTLDNEKKVQKFESFLRKLEHWQASTGSPFLYKPFSWVRLTHDIPPFAAEATNPEQTDALPLQLLYDGSNIVTMLTSQHLFSKIEEIYLSQVFSLLHIQIRAAKSLEFGSTLSVPCAAIRHLSQVSHSSSRTRMKRLCPLLEVGFSLLFFCFGLPPLRVFLDQRLLKKYANIATTGLNNN